MRQSVRVADGAIRNAWRALIDEYAGANPAEGWFGPLFEPLLLAAAAHPLVGELYPYQRLNQLCLAREATAGDLSDAVDLPAIGVGSTGVYAVLTEPGSDGVLITETPDPVLAVAELARRVHRS